MDIPLLQHIGAYFFSQLAMVIWQTYRNSYIKEKPTLSWHNQDVLICVRILTLDSIMSVDAKSQFLPSGCFNSPGVTQRCLVSSMYPMQGKLSGEV